MGVPDQVEVVTRHQKRVGRHALEMQKLLVARHGVLQELVGTVMRQRHLHARMRTETLRPLFYYIEKTAYSVSKVI